MKLLGSTSLSLNLSESQDSVVHTMSNDFEYARDCVKSSVLHMLRAFQLEAYNIMYVRAMITYSDLEVNPGWWLHHDADQFGDRDQGHLLEASL